jgi:Domain of unknown function (DUF6265)
MKNLSIVFISITFLLSSCNSDEPRKTELEKLEWLIGSWSNITEERELHEIWTKVNDTLYSGKSFMIAYQDTVFNETILIQCIGNDVFYIPTVSDQNEGEAIPFKLVLWLNNEFYFENKEHDFPQRICYSNLQSDSLYAYVEGVENGQYHKIEFFLKKQEEN